MRISFGILCHDEDKSLYNLFQNILQHHGDYEYEIVVVYDPSTNERTRNILMDFSNEHDVKIFTRELENDFAAQKNYMTEQCSGDWIINPDADELFPEYLLQNAHLIIEQNEAEVLWLPRINIVNGLTPELSRKLGFQVNDEGYVNWPDPQQRIYKNAYPRIHWIHKVHERLTGFTTHAVLPTDLEMSEHLAIKHVKDIDRQIKQNQKYDKIMGR